MKKTKTNNLKKILVLASIFVCQTSFSYPEFKRHDPRTKTVECFGNGAGMGSYGCREAKSDAKFCAESRCEDIYGIGNCKELRTKVTKKIGPPFVMTWLGPSAQMAYCDAISAYRAKK